MIESPADKQGGVAAPMGGESGPADEHDGICQSRGDAEFLWRGA
jgi:hypothetical protein